METKELAYIWMPEKNSIAEFNTNEAESVPKKFLGKYCVDNNFINSGNSRYGMWKKDSSPLVYWAHIPFNEFPSEFKTQLLLLGIA